MAWTRWFSVATLVSSLALAGAACSSGSSGSTGGGSDCAAYASAVCAKLESCTPDVVTFNWGTDADCRSRFTAMCQTAGQEPGVGDYAGFISSCSSAYASASCDAIYSPLPGCTPPAGTFASGQACGTDAQCQSLFCNKAAGATCGTCAATPKVGDACTGACGVALTCSSGKCAVRPTGAALGAPCSATVPCIYSLTCSGGTCVKPLGAGQSCSATTPGCSTLAGLTCSGGVCTQIQTASAGQPCGLTGTSYVACSGGATCKTASGSSSGTCVAPADDGQACDATNGPSCKVGATCLNGRCTLDAVSGCK
jgi:hypothetical protein